VSESVPDSTPGMARQIGIYLQGRSGNWPGQPVVIEDLAEMAKLNLMADVDLTPGLAGCLTCAELGRGNLIEGSR